MILHNEKCIAALPLGGIISGSVCKSLFTNKRGEVWLGTNHGLNRINYSFANNNFTYNNIYFTTSDGLRGEQVNDIDIKDSTVYVATSEGISFFPITLQLPATDIPMFITGVSINNVPAAIKNEYRLKYFENDISIDFSGIDLTGFVPQFEYSTNDGTWQAIKNIDLKKLTPGSYKFKIRAIRRDGKPSASEATVLFVISTPFWKSPFFWFFAVALLFGGVFFLLQRRNRQRQKIALEKLLTEKKLTELEMQALKAQINPNFVFNCLNSIKGFVYDQDFVQADKYLDKFSELLRSTMDNSDASIISLNKEIQYLDNYLQLEKLRFEDKFSYAIFVEADIDKETVFVPAMLLQPYVENAIRHGMRFLENTKGEIIIKVKQENDTLVCTIDDNGIGREKAAELKSKQHIEYQSRGMQLSKRRAELYNIKQEIVDKRHADGTSAGTAIIITIPLSLKP
jgi:two-component sensor histidine kinase